jgi:hypothetical protein
LRRSSEYAVDVDQNEVLAKWLEFLTEQQPQVVDIAHL